MQPASLNRILCATILLTFGSAIAASVQKWVDANGQVHYGDSPPPGAATQSVRVNAPPPSSHPQPVYVSPSSAPANPSAAASGQNQDSEKRQREQQAAAAAALDKLKANGDKALIERCRAQRNNYCDEGVNTIRQRDYERAQMQAADQQAAAMASGRPIPPGQRIQPVNPCPWPQTCTDKKK